LPDARPASLTLTTTQQQLKPQPEPDRPESGLLKGSTRQRPACQQVRAINEE
jgi:hypothetical protein